MYYTYYEYYIKRKTFKKLLFKKRNETRSNLIRMAFKQNINDSDCL